MKRGRPAPEPMNTLSKPMSNSSSTDRTFPMTMFVSTLTPRSRRVSISFSTMALGRRNSGMP